MTKSPPRVAREWWAGLTKDGWAKWLTPKNPDDTECRHAFISSDGKDECESYIVLREILPAEPQTARDAEEIADLEIKRLAKELNIGRAETEAVWIAATARAEEAKVIAVGMHALATDVVKAQLSESMKELSELEVERDDAQAAASIHADEHRKARHELADLKAKLAEHLAASDVGSEFNCPKCGTPGNCASTEASEEPGF